MKKRKETERQREYIIQKLIVGLRTLVTSAFFATASFFCPLSLLLQGKQGGRREGRGGKRKQGKVTES
jgi:hypothetical protein